jgi:hypothetical protein
MRNLLFLIVLALTASAWSQSSHLASTPTPTNQKFAGVWWSKADAEERSGFLNGTADCLTWTAHRKGFNATPEQLDDRITKFYKAHPESFSLSIIDVWQKVADQPKASNRAEDHGEAWKNAHWYLNGDWWSQVSKAQQLGFVEGYLWCLKTQVSAPTESYSGSASSYRRKIDAFVKANPKQGNEAVAITLRRYRDQDAVTASK